MLSFHNWLSITYQPYLPWGIFYRLRHGDSAPCKNILKHMVGRWNLARIISVLKTFDWHQNIWRDVIVTSVIWWRHQKTTYRESAKKTDKSRSRRHEKVVDPSFEAYWIILLEYWRLNSTSCSNLMTSALFSESILRNDVIWRQWRHVVGFSWNLIRMFLLSTSNFKFEVICVTLWLIIA